MTDVPSGVLLTPEPAPASPGQQAHNKPAGITDAPLSLAQALEDRLRFSHAEGLLAGLMDCTPANAGHALLVAAARLGMSPRAAAESLLDLMATADVHRESLMLLLAAATAPPPDRMRAVEALWDEHGAVCYALAVAILGNEQLAAGVVRSVFLEAWRNENLLGSPAGRAGLLSSTRREAIVAIRTDRTAAGRIEAAVAPVEPHGGTHVDVHPVQLHAATIGTLSRDRSEIVRLAYFGGYTQQQIAHITGRPLKEVKAGMLAAMRNLAEERRLRTAASDTGSAESAGPDGIAGLGLLL